MPTLVIDNVPISLYDQIQHLAKARHRTPADTVLEVLEIALCSTTSVASEPPLPQEPFLTEEISAPCDVPRPEGRLARAERVAAPLPIPHDVPFPSDE